jgi:hypothetical protein
MLRFNRSLLQRAPARARAREELARVLNFPSATSALKTPVLAFDCTRIASREKIRAGTHTCVALLAPVVTPLVKYTMALKPHKNPDKVLLVDKCNVLPDSPLLSLSLSLSRFSRGNASVARRFRKIPCRRPFAVAINRNLSLAGLNATKRRRSQLVGKRVPASLTRRRHRR